MNYLINILQRDSNKLLVSRATQYLLIALICLIPFSIRNVIDSSWNFETGAYSDFTSLSIYLSDIILGLFFVSLILAYFQRKAILPLQATVENSVDMPVIKLWKKATIALSIWIIAELFFSTILPLQAYFTFRLLVLIIFAVSLTKLSVSRETIAWTLAILGFLQSLIATAQFYLQKSIGLYILGESHLAPDMFGVAKIVSHGTTMIRGYGTFPHSNLLAAFLVIATLLNLYLIINTYQKPRGRYHVVGLYVLLAVNIFGVFVSFSRGGIVALFGSLIVFGLYILIYKRFSSLVKLIVSCGTAILVSILILAPYLSSRTTVSDNAVKERMFYNQIGQRMIEDKPVFGLGAGTSVLHMKQYTETELKPWEIQPIHNYYLISWAELGFGALFLLFITFLQFAFIGYSLIRKKSEEIDYWNVALVAISAGISALFLIDHYFYTIWPTQLLLWLVIGLAISTVSHETVENTKIPQQ